MIPTKREFHHLLYDVIFILISLFSEKLEWKNHCLPLAILGIFDLNHHYNFRASEAKVPMVSDQNGCCFWLSQIQKHGNQCSRLWIFVITIFWTQWTGLTLHAFQEPPLGQSTTSVSANFKNKVLRRQIISCCSTKMVDWVTPWS